MINQNINEKKKTIKKWLKGLSCGLVSLFSCCFCCGCCGNVGLTGVFDDIDNIKNVENIENVEKNKKIIENQKKIINITSWCAVSTLAYKTVLTCGCCLGCCGKVSPEDVLICLSVTDNKK